MGVVSLIGPTYNLPSRPASVQRTVNLVPYPLEPGNERSPMAFRDSYGLEDFCALPAGLRGVFESLGTLYAIAGDRLYSISNTGAVSHVASIGTSSGRISFTQNQSHLVFTDGVSLYAYKTGDPIQQVANYEHGKTLAFISQFIVFEHKDSQRFGWTEAGDATTILADSFASAEGVPDKLVAVIHDNGELVLLGETSGEIWSAIGGESVFSRNGSAFIEYGCVSPYSAQRISNSICWLGRDERGQGVVLRSSGYRAVVVSNAAIESYFLDKDLSNAYAFTFTEGKHSFYVLQVPNADTALVFDAYTGLWHERAELVDGNYRPWRATCHAFAYGRHYFGSDSGIIYRSSPTISKYGSDVNCRDRVVPVLSVPGRKLMRFQNAEIVCEKATDAEFMLRWSDDNGATWGDWLRRDLGNTGEYEQRAIIRRLGSARDRVFQIRCTDNAPFNPVMMEVEAA